ncbi:MAG: metallophosphatase domain-containing protein [Bacteroidales bacterium]|nr:metallophosphatase domain-containing protein [Bacteroidales bacterium]
MTILHLSDTHGKHRELADMPPADVLVHSGDFTLAGGDMEVLDFIEWLCDLPYQHKIFISGNHDDCMLDAALEGLPDDVHYLADSGITIDGVTFYGAPMFVGMVDGDLREIEHYEEIPNGVDVLITHRPPLGILDSIDGKIYYGSSMLLDKVKTIRPKLHLFGHVHGAYGSTAWNGTSFSNAALADWKYNLRYSPQIIDLDC